MATGGLLRADFLEYLDLQFHLSKEMYTFEKEVLSCPLVFVLTLLILFAGMERPGVILTGGPRKPNTPATAAPPAAAKLTSTKLTSHSLSSHKFSTTTAAAFAATSAF